jgi:HAL2 family 3'(2'),5'-bisphosphate nucleotidase
MNVDPWQREFAVALRAVREGARVARHVRERVRDCGWLKPDQSPVTVADFTVQALVAHRLRESFPDDPLVAEEDASVLRSPSGQAGLEQVMTALGEAVPDLDPGRTLDLIDAGRAAPADRFWTLDPVDGTQGFVRGDQYVVVLALVVRGEVAIGVIGCPAMAPVDQPAAATGWIACAVRARGAFAASLREQEALRPLHVSACRDPRLARVLRSFEPAHINLPRFDAILQFLGAEVPPALMDSQAKHALVAAGGADLLIRVPAARSFRDKIWDQAAGSLIVEEAGGRVTDLNGRRLDFGTGRLLDANEGVVASNGLLHDAVLAAVRRASQRRPGVNRGA